MVRHANVVRRLHIRHDALVDALLDALLDALVDEMCVCVGGLIQCVCTYS